MMQIRKAHERGSTHRGWLESRHTFSFGDYHDPKHTGFGPLRVINEDTIQPATGFSPHSHRDMEIITYVLSGALEHTDSMGNSSVIRPGDVQLMRAGTGVTHSESNPSNEEVVHLYQIWILPDTKGLPPAYEQRHVPVSERQNALRRVVSPDGREGSLRIRQDATIALATLDPGCTVRHALAEGRNAWIQMVRGQALLNGVSLEAGDGAALVDEPRGEITAETAAEVLVFDLKGK